MAKYILLLGCRHYALLISIMRYLRMRTTMMTTTPTTKRHRLLSFYSIFSHIESLACVGVRASVCIYFVIIHIKAFSIFPTSRSITHFERQSRQKGVRGGRFVEHIESEEERDQENCQSIQSSIRSLCEHFYILCVLCPTILTCCRAFFSPSLPFSSSSSLELSLKLTNELNTALRRARIILEIPWHTVFQFIASIHFSLSAHL